MDQSISIPDSLVLRSLPINIELLELIKSEPQQPDYFGTGEDSISRILDDRRNVQNLSSDEEDPWDEFQNKRLPSK
jgi:hypothetical protein